MMTNFFFSFQNKKHKKDETNNNKSGSHHPSVSARHRLWRIHLLRGLLPVIPHLDVLLRAGNHGSQFGRDGSYFQG